MINHLDRYISRLIFVPLIATLLVSALLLLLDKMLRLFTFVIDEGGPVTVVWQMLGNLIPQYLALGIPIGLLLSVILSFRKLAVGNEMDAITSSGVSHLRLLVVPFLLAGLLAFVTLWLVGFIQPYSRYAYEGLRFELRSGALGASIKVGEFAHLGKKLTLRIEESREGGRVLSGIFVHAEDKDGSILTVTADRGTFLATDDPNIVLFRLFNGELVLRGKDSSTQRLLQFDQHDLPVDLPEFEAFRARGNEYLELTLPELLITQNDENKTPKAKLEASANFHRRLVQVAVLFVIPFLGMGLAIPPKRNTSALGVFAGIVILVVYNEISEFCEKLSSDGVAPAAVLQWVPFAVFALYSVWLFRQVAYRVGEPPIGRIIRTGETLTKQMKRLITPFRRRRKLAH
ncbi:LptF/LptG family permease [Pedomonas sp. V897]|uniref:LptF/LptG family permease n=1 Tax=Pedomonas sp. V897 TaxID=3446482 RepID=UPI003EE410C1